jgi:hypothetical protein
VVVTVVTMVTMVTVVTMVTMVVIPHKKEDSSHKYILLLHSPRRNLHHH